MKIRDVVKLGTVAICDYLLDKFSYSKLNCFSKCPRQAWYRYIQRLPFKVSPWILFGRGVHGGQEADNYAKLRGERLSVENVLEAAVAEYEHEIETSNLDRRLFPIDPFAEEHKAQLEVFDRSGLREQVQPVPGSIEAGFQMEVLAGDGDGTMKPAVVEGFVDVVSVNPDGTKEVINYKSAGRPTSVKEVDQNLQLSMEAIGSGCTERKIICFLKAGKQKPTTKAYSSSKPPQEQLALQFIGDTISDFRWSVKHDCWPKCDRSCRWCGAGFCEFYGLCYPRDIDIGKVIVVKKISPVGTLPPATWRESFQGQRESMRKDNK